MKNLIFIIVLLSAAWTCKNAHAVKSDNSFQPNYPLHRFESTIRGYERRDSVLFPGTGNIVFGGSSSIFFWETLANDMLPLTAVNYGFGGSTFPEVTYYATRTILKNNPKAIVIYCENDLFIQQPKTPAQVLADYTQLVHTIRQTQPKTPLFFISLKPSPSRWKRWSESAEVNRLIQEFGKSQKNHYYIDIVPCMMKDGRPDAVIFNADSLHMNAEGYVRWTNVIRPILLEKCK